MRKYTFLSCLFSLSLLFSAQVMPVDSLKQVLTLLNNRAETIKEDTTKVKTLVWLSYQYKNMGNYDSSLMYSKQAIDAAKTCIEKSGYNKQSAFYKVSQKWNSRAFNNIGIVYNRQGNYPEALKYLFIALKIREEMNDKDGIAASYNNIGNVYDNLHNYPEALKNFFAALKINKELHLEARIADSYNNIGNVYVSQNNLAAALQNYTASLKIRIEVSDKHGVAASYGNIGVVYMYEGNIAYTEGNKTAAMAKYSESVKNHFACLKIMEEMGNKEGVDISYLNIGSAYNKLKNYKEAEIFSRKALTLSTEIGDLDGIKSANQCLSDIYANTGRFRESLETYKLFIASRDSLNNEENTKKTVRMQMNYEFDKKEAVAAAESSRREAVAAAESRKQKIIILAVTSGLLLILILAVVILRSLRINQKKNKIITRQKELVEAQKELVEEKQKEILDSIHYAKRIQTALLPNELFISKNLSRLFKN